MQHPSNRGSHVENGLWGRITTCGAMLTMVVIMDVVVMAKVTMAQVLIRVVVSTGPLEQQ